MGQCQCLRAAISMHQEVYMRQRGVRHMLKDALRLQFGTCQMGVNGQYMLLNSGHGYSTEVNPGF